MELQNKKLSNDVFFAEQKEILNQWPTGAAVNFEEAIKFHQELPEHKNFGKKLLKAKAEGKTLVQPRAGVALVKDHIDQQQSTATQDRTDIKKQKLVSRNPYVNASPCSTVFL